MDDRPRQIDFNIGQDNRRNMLRGRQPKWKDVTKYDKRPYQRCPGCGGKVKLPCIACSL